MVQNYIKTALRNLRRNKTYTAMNIIGLGMGIASALVIFTLCTFHLNYEKHYEKAEQIYRIATDINYNELIQQPGIPQPFAVAFREDFPEIKEVTAFRGWGSDLVTLDRDGQKKTWEIDESTKSVEPSYFDIFDLKFIVGSPSVLKEPNKAVLSQTAAKKIFGDENPLGKTFLWGSDTQLQVEGIVEDSPENTDYGAGLFVSYATHTVEMNEKELNNWGSISSAHQCFIVLPKSIKPESLAPKLRTFADKHIPEKPEIHEFVVQPLVGMHFDKKYTGDTSYSVVYALLMIALFLVVIACINFVNMATAQAIKRSKEVGVRKAIGGSRMQIFTQFMSETFIIIAISMLIAVFLAKLAMPVVSDITDIKLTFEPFTNPVLSLSLLLLSAFVTLLGGFYPALILSGFKPVRALKGAVTTHTLGGFNLRRALVVTQFAVCQFLILALLVVNNQISYIKDADLGFKTEGIVSIPNRDTDIEKSRSLKNELSQITGVKGISLHWTTPSDNNNNSTSHKLEGRAENEDWAIYTKLGDADFIKLFDLKLLAGENYRPSDTTTGFLINETAMSMYGFQKHEEIIGKNIQIFGRTAPIVGILKDFHLHSLEHEIRPVVVTNIPEDYSRISMNIDLSQTESVMAQIEKIWRKHFPDGYYTKNFYDEQIAQYYESEDALLKMMRFFCGIALIIACLGLYGLVSFMALRKQKEIGVRKVLGASVQQILSIFGKEFSILMALGFVVAAPLAYFAMSGWLNDYAYRISLSISIFATTIFATAILTFLTVGWKSARSALMHPSKSLRSE